MAIDKANRTVRMLVTADDGEHVDTWQGTGLLGEPKPDGTYMTEDEVATWFDLETGTRQTLRLCNHEGSCGLPDNDDLEVVAGRIRAKQGRPQLDEYNPATMQRQFLEFDDGHIHRLEKNEWTDELVNAPPERRKIDGHDHLGRPQNPRVV